MSGKIKKISIKTSIIITIISLSIMLFFSFISCSSGRNQNAKTTYDITNIYSIAIASDKNQAFETALNLLAAQHAGYKFAISKDVFAAKANKIEFKKNYSIYYKTMPDNQILCVMSTPMPSKRFSQRRYYSIHRKVPVLAFADDSLREKLFSTMLSILFKNSISSNNFLKGYLYITYLPELKNVKKIPEKINLQISALK